MKKIYFDTQVHSPETVETGFNTVWKTDTETLEKLHAAIRRVLSGALNLDPLQTRNELKLLQPKDRHDIEQILNSLSYKVFEFRYYQTNHKEVVLADFIEFFCTQYFYEK